MNTPNPGAGSSSSSAGGRISSTSSNDPLRQVKVEQRRVVDSDRNQLGDNNRNLIQVAGTSNLKNISSHAEFTRQMKTQIARQNGRVTPTAVKRSAVQMYIMGRSPQSIAKGLRHYNQQFSRMSTAEFRNYFNRHIKPALQHPKVVRARQNNEAFKRQHGIPKTYNNVEGMRKISARVQQQRKQLAQVRQQKEQRQIAQNRKQGIQHTRRR